MFDFNRNALLGKISAEPLCAQYKQAWRACGDDKEMLMRLALSQQSLPYLISSCYRKLGLSKEYIMDNFGEYINGNKTFYDVEGVNGFSYALYVGYKGIFDVATDVQAMMWCTNTHCTVEYTKSPVIYIGCSSHVHLSLDGYNCPKIYLFDDSKVEIDDADNESKVIVYRYSKDAQVELGRYCFADVKIFDKQLKL